MDVFDKATRSKIMASIKSTDTQPEIKVRKFLFSKGFRYRLHGKDLPGSPDIVLPKYKTVIFVNGCFWHGHPCKIGSGKRMPKSNSKFWERKIKRNINRDLRTKKQLMSLGWKVITVWECESKIDRKMSKKLKPLLDLKD
ncbi:DNA mismatch endonuclease Vsr [bacterium]|nr:DNA mismatch endonuclease Vsr [bacterium]